jgi:hypothetical protein
MKTNRALGIAFIIVCGVLFSTAGFAQATKKPAPKTATAKAADAATLIDLNTASKDDLMKLPGIGDATRRRSSLVVPTRRRTNSSPRFDRPSGHLREDQGSGHREASRQVARQQARVTL